MQRHSESREEEQTLTSDQLGALDHVRVWMVDGDLKGCRRRREEGSAAMLTAEGQVGFT